MAPAFVQTLGANEAATATTLRITPVTTTAGNMIVVCQATRKASTTVSAPTDSAGNTYTKVTGASLDSTPLYGDIWYCANAAALSAGWIQANVSPAADVAMTMIEYSGMGTAPVVDIATVASGTSTAPTVSSGVLGQASELLVGFICWQLSTSTPAAGGSWTNGLIEHSSATSQNVSVYSASQITAATTSQTFSGTITSATWYAAIASWKVSASPLPAVTISGASTLTPSLGAKALMSVSISDAASTVSLPSYHTGQLGVFQLGGVQLGGGSILAFNPQAKGNVAVTASGISTVTPSLSATGAISCTISGASTETASLSATGALSITVSGTSALAPSAAATGAMTLTASALSTVTVNLAAPSGQLPSCSINGASTEAAAIAGTATLACTTSATSTLTVSLSGAAPVSSTISGASTLAPAISATGAVPVAMASASTLAASTVGMGAALVTISARTTLSATTAGTAALTANANGASTLTPSLSGSAAIALTVNGASTLAASVLAGAPVSVAISASTSLTASLGGNVSVAAITVAASGTLAVAIAAGQVSLPAVTISDTSTMAFSYVIGPTQLGVWQLGTMQLGGRGASVNLGLVAGPHPPIVLSIFASSSVAVALGSTPVALPSTTISASSAVSLSYVPGQPQLGAWQLGSVQLGGVGSAINTAVAGSINIPAVTIIGTSTLAAGATHPLMPDYRLGAFMLGGVQQFVGAGVWDLPPCAITGTSTVTGTAAFSRTPNPWMLGGGALLGAHQLPGAGLGDLNPMTLPASSSLDAGLYVPAKELGQFQLGRWAIPHIDTTPALPMSSTSTMRVALAATAPSPQMSSASTTFVQLAITAPGPFDLNHPGINAASSVTVAVAAFAPIGPLVVAMASTANATLSAMANLSVPILARSSMTITVDWLPDAFFVAIFRTTTFGSTARGSTVFAICRDTSFMAQPRNTVFQPTK